MAVAVTGRGVLGILFILFIFLAMSILAIQYYKYMC